MTDERDDDGGSGVNWSEIAMTAGVVLGVIALLMLAAQHSPKMRELAARVFRNPQPAA